MATWTTNVAIAPSGGITVTGGNNVTVSGGGTLVGNLSGNADTASVANAVAVVANSTNASYRVPFLSTSTGAAQVQSDSGLTYNPSTNTLTATTFDGDLTGNASSATLATTATSADTVTTVASGTNTNYRVAFLSGTSGNVTMYNDSGLIYNPSTNVLDVAGRLTIGNTYGIDTTTVSVGASSNYTVSWPSPSQTTPGPLTAGSTSIVVPYSGLWSINAQATSSTFNGADVFGLTVYGSMWLNNSSYGVLSSGLPAYSGSTYHTTCNFTGYLASNQTNTLIFRNNRNDGVAVSVAFEIEIRLLAMI